VPGPVFRVRHAADQPRKHDPSQSLSATHGGDARGVSRNPDPVAGWSDDLVETTSATVEGGEAINSCCGSSPIFRRRPQETRAGQLNTLEDLFLDLMLRDNPGENFKWLQKFFATASDPARQNDLSSRRRTAEY